MNASFRIALATIADQLRHKSFFVLLVVCIACVAMLRGCYKGSYVVNGQTVDAATVAWQASKIAFHLIASGALLIAALLSMNALRRDRDEGVLTLTMSRPVARWAYVAGKIVGLWLLCFALMFALHLTIFLTALQNAGGVIPGFLAASALCGVNLLFMIAAVCLLSMIMPDVVAALSGLALWAVSFGSDSFYRVAHSDMLKSAIPQNIDSSPALWRILWPKITAVQYFASTFVTKDPFTVMGPIHPLVNITLWTAAAVALLIWRFGREDVEG